VPGAAGCILIPPPRSTPIPSPREAGRGTGRGVRSLDVGCIKMPPGQLGSDDFAWAGCLVLSVFEQFQEQSAVDVAVPIANGHGHHPEGMAKCKETHGPTKGKHENIERGKKLAARSRVVFGVEKSVKHENHYARVKGGVKQTNDQHYPACARPFALLLSQAFNLLQFSWREFHIMRGSLLSIPKIRQVDAAGKKQPSTLQQPRLAARRLQPKLLVAQFGCHAALRGAVEVAFHDQERLIDFFQRVRLLAHRHGQ